MALTLDQQRAVAMANARARADNASAPGPQNTGAPSQFVAGLTEGIKPATDAMQQFFTGGLMPQGGPSVVANAARSAVGMAPMPQPAAPQTPGQSLARTLGQNLPNALMPGSAVARAANVVLPTAGSEGAGTLTKGTPFEGAARLAGALAGGAGAGLMQRGQDIAAAVKSVPSIDDIKNAASTLYDKVKAAGVVVKDTAFKNFADDLQDHMKDAGIDPTITPKASAALNRITDAASVPSGQNAPNDLSLNDVSTLRKVASKASMAPDKEDRSAARMIVDKIDDFIGNLSPNDVRSGNAPQAVSMLNQARGMWRTASNSEMIQGLIDKAKANSDVTTLDNSLRSQFQKFANNPRAMGRFSPDEQQAITDVAKGGPVQQTASLLGRLFPSTSSISAAGIPARLVAAVPRSQNAQLAAAMARGARAPAQAVPGSNIAPGLAAQLAALLQGQQQ